MMNTKQAQQMVNQALSLYDSKVKAAQANPVDEIRSQSLDLSTARTRENALKVSFPFKTVFVEQATDSDCFIKMIPESDLQGRSSITLSLRDSIETEFGFSSCYLFWPEQPGKSMVLKFATTSNIKSGKVILSSGNTQTVSIGSNTLDVDGSLVLVQANKETALGPGSFGLATPLNKETNGELNYGGIPQQSFFIPEGFYGKLVACEIEVLNGAVGVDNLVVIPIAEGEDASGLLDLEIYQAYSGTALAFGRHGVVFDEIGDDVKIPSGCTVIFSNQSNFAPHNDCLFSVLAAIKIYPEVE